MNKSNLKVFLEIGTSDFDTNLEFIDSGNWRGIMVEPSPPFFSNIKKRASQSKYHYNLILDNSVISDSNSFVDFAVSKDGRPNSIFCGIGQCQSCLVRKENGESVEACLCSCIENERFYSSDSRGDAHEQ